MKQVSVCALEDLPEGSMRSFQIDGREVVIVRTGNRVFALRNTCPHQGARLSDGVLSCRRVAGAVGEYLHDDDTRVVRCPWHNWEFDVSDGVSMHDPEGVRVATYEVGVADGQVYVRL